SASANFYKIDTTQLTYSGTVSGATPSVGGCLVSAYTTTPGSSTQPTGGTTVPTIQYTGLDAGPQISLTGPQSLTLLPAPKAKGDYSSTTQSALPAGTYTANIPGGADVGAFTTTINNGNFLTWTNQAAASKIDRTQPFNVTWTGGDPS